MFSRRSFLRGAAGAGLGLLGGLERHLVREAYGAPNPRRLILYYANLGTREQYRPVRTGPDETAFDLKSFRALEPHRSKLLVINKLWNPFNLHLHGNRWTLTARNMVGDREPGGPSIDRVIAQHVGAMDPVSSLNLLMFYDKKAGSKSADGKQQVYPIDRDIVQAYDRIYGGQATEGEDARARRARRESRVLDWLSGDIRRLERRLASSEKEKMERYLAAVDNLQGRIDALAMSTNTCGTVPLPTEDDIGTRSEVTKARMNAALDMVSTSLICGLTQVAVLNVRNETIPWLPKDGDKGTGSHDMWHGGGTDREHDAYYNFMAEHIATLWSRLEAEPEGNGTMADNTTILWVNEAGSHHNNGHLLWFFMLGGLGAFRTGRMVDLPSSDVAENDLRRRLATPSDKAPKTRKEAADRSVADLYLTLARAYGVPLSEFGDSRINQGELQALY